MKGKEHIYVSSACAFTITSIGICSGDLVRVPGPRALTRISAPRGSGGDCGGPINAIVRSVLRFLVGRVIGSRRKRAGRVKVL